MNQHEGHIFSIESTPQEIPPPEFVLTKPDIHWNEEEKKVFEEYEKKTKDLSEKKEKYKKVSQSIHSQPCFAVITNVTDFCSVINISLVSSVIAVAGN